MIQLAIGLMSGTSADGIELALVEISGRSTTTKVRQLAFIRLLPMPLRNRILRVAAGDFRQQELSELLMGQMALTPVWPSARRQVLTPTALPLWKSWADGLPCADGYCGCNVSGTLQIGEASLICDFWLYGRQRFPCGIWLRAVLARRWCPTPSTFCTKTRHVPWRCKTSVASAASQYLQGGAKGWRSFCL